MQPPSPQTIFPGPDTDAPTLYALDMTPQARMMLSV